MFCAVLRERMLRSAAVSWGERVLSAECGRLMTFADRNDLVATSQEKLEWVTPQISLMGSGKTNGKEIVYFKEIVSATSPAVGPS